MQLIPLSQLKQLAATQKSISESDATVALYDEFKEEYSKTYSFFAKTSEAPEEATYQVLLNGWIREHCPPIQLIGQGSSRAAFACGDGRCLKVAMNEQGIQQNKAEYENTALPSSMRYPIFAETYAKSSSYESLLTECCAKITTQEWARLWKINDKTFIEAPESYVLVVADALHSSKWDWNKAIKQLERPQAAFAQKAKAARDPAMKTLKSLFDFYAADESNWEKLMPFDLCTADNWGAAIRFGEVVPVIIDAGFSSATFDLTDFGI